MISDRKEPPIGLAAQMVARTANVSALLQAIGIGAQPIETIEGLLVATETAILVQLAVGSLDKDGAAALRNRIVEWSLDVADQMEADGTAEEMRKQYAEALAAYRETNGKSGDMN